jgi:hypothetical protein
VVERASSEAARVNGGEEAMGSLTGGAFRAAAAGTGVGGERGRRHLLLAVSTVTVVFWIGYAAVRPTNFGGADEWLYLDLASRGVLGIPYANRPLVLLWHVIPASVWPHSLRAFWAFNGLYLGLAGALTAVLAARLAPRSRRLALLAGTFAAVWAPLDALRLDSVLGCGYAGFTFATTAALVLFVESWRRRRLTLLAVGALLGFVAARGVEAVVPLLVVAPLLVGWPEMRERPRFVRWAVLWEGAALLALGLAVLPVLLGTPSYQSGALGLDPAPLRVLHRLGQLLGRQAAPLVTSAPRELLAPAVPAAVLVFLALAVAAGVRLGGDGSRRDALRLFLLGLVLAGAAHGGIALTPVVETPSRTQILSAPGFGLALAGGIGLLASALPSRLSAWAVLLAGAWVVAVGTGRTTALQGEWDRDRGVYAEQYRTLEGLVARAPELAPGTLVMLMDESGAWPLTLTFRHAIAYLYPGQAVGLVANGQDFLYPWWYTPGGVHVDVDARMGIRSAWRELPTFHPWPTIVVVRQPASGPPELLRTWPSPPLPALPSGARFTPAERVMSRGAPPPSRAILVPPPPGTR